MVRVLLLSPIALGIAEVVRLSVMMVSCPPPDGVLSTEVVRLSVRVGVSGRVRVAKSSHARLCRILVQVLCRFGAEKPTYSHMFLSRL